MLARFPTFPIGKTGDCSARRVVTAGEQDNRQDFSDRGAEQKSPLDEVLRRGSVSVKCELAD